MIIIKNQIETMGGEITLHSEEAKEQFSGQFFQRAD